MVTQFEVPLPRRILLCTLIIAIGGFLFGFDASVISGVLSFIKPQFGLSEFEVGWLVSSPSLSAMFSMLFVGRISDLFGRKRVMMIIALFYSLSAFLSAIAPTYLLLVGARMMGGIAFGSALVIAPLYITEIAPSSHRGRLVSYQQLNIVLGFSAAYFSNYMILILSNKKWFTIDEFWRVMLGIELFPAICFFFLLFFIPESPRWYQLRGKKKKSLRALTYLFTSKSNPEPILDASILADFEGKFENSETSNFRLKVKKLFSAHYRVTFFIALILGIVQQITGINVIFFYAPLIFEKTGLSQDASLGQAVIIGFINLIFTFVAINLIDRVGRKPLLMAGLIGILCSLLLISTGFQRATYQVDAHVVQEIGFEDPSALGSIYNIEFTSDKAFREALDSLLTKKERLEFEAALFSAAIQIELAFVLIGILGFVASFAFSLGPVMWVMISELFPNTLRGVAISIIGFTNSFTSWLVQFLFPVQISTFGNAETYGLYAIFTLIGLIILWQLLPETKGKSLSEIQRLLASSKEQLQADV